jgi:hypothetical protein
VRWRALYQRPPELAPPRPKSCPLGFGEGERSLPSNADGRLDLKRSLVYAKTQLEYAD